MSSKKYLGGIALSALIGWIVLGIVLFKIDPLTSTALALPFFFGGILLAGTGTLALLGFYGRVWFYRGEIYLAHISIALRQAFLFTFTIALALGFQILRILTWWDSILLVLAVTLIEIYFSSQD